MVQSTTDLTTSGTIEPKDAIIKDSELVDVTSNYNITYELGTLTINKATPIISLNSQSATLSINETKSLVVSAKVGSRTVSGTYEVNSNNPEFVTATVLENKITLIGKSVGNTSIVITFTPTDLVNYNLSSDLSYEVKVNITTATRAITNSAVNYETASSSDFTGGLVKIDSNGDLSNSSSVREYRYSGPKVNNYVYFNCKDEMEQNRTNCEIWQIVGVFYERGYQHLKIVKSDRLNTTSSWGATSGGNNWENSYIKSYLNTTYYNSLSTNAKNMIEETTYYLGTFQADDDNAKTAYIHERDVSNCINNIGDAYYGVSSKGCQVWTGNIATWKGNIALLYPSDVGYSSTSNYWETKMDKYPDSLRDASWLQPNNHGGSNAEWLLSPSDGVAGNYASRWFIPVKVSDFSVGTDGGIRPTTTLKYNVNIVGGDGSSNSPYQLESLVSSTPNNQEGPAIVDDNIGTNKTASIGRCNNLVYNGEEQTLVSGGKNVTYSNNTGKDAGSYTVNAKTKNGYFFSDGSTSKTLTCTIEKKAVTVNYSSNQVKYTGGLVSPIATATGVKGENIELETTKESSIGDYTMITTMKNVNPNYTLRNTVYDYKIFDGDVKENNNIKTTYKVNYYLMNKDLVNYTLVKSNSYDAKVGEIITPKVLDFSGYKSPKNITIEIIKGENIINYYYERLDFNK